MDIGFIGLGNMGSRIVELMLDSGQHVTLWARRPASLEPFSGRVDVATSPLEVGRASQVVGICVWDEHDVDDVVLGDDGVLAGMSPGGVIAVHSTISPAGARRLQSAAAERGVGVVDAPVSFRAHLPKLLVMLGGDPDAVERSREALASFADPVIHLGPIGSGLIAKLINNTLLAATVALGDDAIALGHELGLDEAALATVLAAGSSGGTWAGLLAGRRSITEMTGRTNEWATKDVGLTQKLAAEAAVGSEREVLRMAARGADVLS